MTTLAEAEKAWDDALDTLAESRGISKSSAGMALAYTDEGRRLYNEINAAKSRAIFGVKKVRNDVRKVADELLAEKARQFAAEHAIPLHGAYTKLFDEDQGARDLYAVSAGYEPSTKVAPPPPPGQSDGELAQEELSRLSRDLADKTGKSYQQAINAVLQTPRGKELYARIYAGHPK